MKNNLLKFTITAASSTLLLAVLPSGAVPPAPNPPNPVSQPANAVIGRPGFGQRLGMFSQLEEGTKVLGSPIQVTNQTIAKINDVVIDFESGRLLYVVAAMGTNNTNNRR